MTAALASTSVLRTAAGEPPLGRDAAFFRDDQGEIIIHDNGETCVVSTIRRAIDRFGEAATVFGLKTIVSTGGGNPGLLSQTIIWGVIEVLHDHPEWCRDVKALYVAFDDFDIEEIWRKATSAAARVRGSSSTDQFEGLLVEALGKRLAKQGVEA